MTKGYDSRTVCTGESSLHNVNYEPSENESSVSTDSRSQPSVLSSVRSDLRRDLQKQNSQKYSKDAQNCSMESSESTMMWQDTETEDELYSSASDDQTEIRVSQQVRTPDKTKLKTRQQREFLIGENDQKYLQSGLQPEHELQCRSPARSVMRHNVDDEEERYHADTSGSGGTVTTRSSASKDQYDFKQLRTRNSVKSDNSMKSKRFTKTDAARGSREPHNLNQEIKNRTVVLADKFMDLDSLPKYPIRKDIARDKTVSDMPKKSVMPQRRSREPTAQHQQLRFSSESLTQVVQARNIQQRYTAKPRRKRDKQLKLENVDYLSAVEVATHNKDASTFHPIGREDCNSVFHRKVPHEIPVSGWDSDDVSSIQALSTKASPQNSAKTCAHQSSITNIAPSNQYSEQKSATISEQTPSIRKSDYNETTTSTRTASAGSTESSSESTSTFRVSRAQGTSSSKSSFHQHKDKKDREMPTNANRGSWSVDSFTTSSSRKSSEQTNQPMKTCLSLVSTDRESLWKQQVPNSKSSASEKGSEDQKVENISVTNRSRSAKEDPEHDDLERAMHHTMPQEANTGQPTANGHTFVQLNIWFQAFRHAHGGGELFFMIVVAVSVLTLILLVIVILNL